MGKHRKTTRRDEAEIARSVVQQAISAELSGEPLETDPEAEEQSIGNPAAVALSKLGASKGGKARTKKLSKKHRREIAKKAAEALWGEDSF